MDEIEQRLREGAESCITNYEAWRKDKKNASVREALMEAIHELRKIASRLEIELAVSERDEMAQRPLPIPPHRDSRQRPRGGNDFDQQDEDQGDGNESQTQASQQERGRNAPNNTMRRRLHRRSEGPQRRPDNGGNNNGNF